MFKTLTAIALNLLLLASPARALMADDLDGFSESGGLDGEVTFGITIRRGFCR